MLFLIHREGPSLYRLFVVGGCYVLSVAYETRVLPFGGDRLEAGFSAPVIASFLAVTYAIFLIIALRPRIGGGSNPFYILGLITYPLYLLHQDLGFILLRSAPVRFNRTLLLCSVIAAIILFSWLVHAGPEKWLASELKSILFWPQNIVISIRSHILERWAGSTLKSTAPASVVPTVIPATVSTGTPETTQSPAANPPLSKNSDIL
jgi:peptidoglycan/LPS O-acetylase OafA/YrhL